MLLDIIKEDLAENFREGDEDILQEIIDRVTANALSISNRVNNEKNIELIKFNTYIYKTKGKKHANL